MEQGLVNKVEQDKLQLSRLSINPEYFVRYFFSPNFYNHPCLISKIFTFIYILLIWKDVNCMFQLLDLAFSNNYTGFIKEILDLLDNYISMVNNIFSDVDLEPISFVNGCIFVARDLQMLWLILANIIM